MSERKAFPVGARVEVTEGALRGEKATVVHVGGWEGHVLIRFDRESVRLLEVPNQLLTQWMRDTQLGEIDE